MPLVKCGAGTARVLDFEPPIETARDVLYVPAGGAWAETGWGLYDHSGRLVVPAVRWLVASDGAAAPVSGSWTAPADAVVEDAARSPGEWVYGGLLERDEAGFLLETLSRFWSLATSPQAGRRLVFHAREPLADLFEVPLIASTMAALGITPADCVSFDRPVRLDQVVVPAAAFERDRAAFRAYGRLAATLGIRLSGAVVAPELRRGPLHVSSARGPLPVLEDEDAFDRVLEARGIEVVHPSAMSFASLVARVRSAPLVSSTARSDAIDMGSLVSAFGGPAVRMVLVVGGDAAADSASVDLLCGHDTLFVRAIGDDAAALAEAYCRSMRRLAVVRGLGGILPGDGSGRDLGAEAVACVDSGLGDASVLLEGLLTGLAQWRVGGRQYPWVQVEFGETVEVREVRVHGPVVGDDRPSSLSLFGSFDGVDWNLLAERDGEAVGGIDGRAHRFVAGASPWRARWLRLQSGTGVLALDQIELFGAT